MSTASAPPIAAGPAIAFNGGTCTSSAPGHGVIDDLVDQLGAGPAPPAELLDQAGAGEQLGAGPAPPAELLDQAADGEQLGAKRAIGQWRGNFPYLYARKLLAPAGAGKIRARGVAGGGPGALPAVRTTAPSWCAIAHQLGEDLERAPARKSALLTRTGWRTASGKDGFCGNTTTPPRSAPSGVVG